MDFDPFGYDDFVEATRIDVAQDEDRFFDPDGITEPESLEEVEEHDF
jgi:hypothetical protein